MTLLSNKLAHSFFADIVYGIQNVDSVVLYWYSIAVGKLLLYSKCYLTQFAFRVMQQDTFYCHCTDQTVLAGTLS